MVKSPCEKQLRIGLAYLVKMINGSSFLIIRRPTYFFLPKAITNRLKLVMLKSVIVINLF